MYQVPTAASCSRFGSAQCALTAPRAPVDRAMQPPQSTTLSEAAGGASPDLPVRHWEASLRLRFAQQPWGTDLTLREHKGPLRVQKPFYPEGRQVCHVYVLHPPGGLVQGDALRINVSVQTGAHALLTTPAAGKVYRSNLGQASQVVLAEVDEGGVLEWLPQETIVFSGARAALKTQILLAGAGKVMAWEIICLGRPAAGETFDAGICSFHFALHKDGVPLYIERNVFAGGTDTLAAFWGLGGFAAMGAFVAYPGTPQMLQAVREIIDAAPNAELCTATLVDQTLICRVLESDAGRARNRLVDLWSALRPLCLDRPASPPRIWAT